MSPTVAHDLHLRRQGLIRLVAFFMIVGLIFWLIVWVENMLTSCLFAFVVSYLLAPVVSRFERRGVDRVFATTGLFVLIGVFLAFLGTLAAPAIGNQLAELQANAPRYTESLAQALSNLESRLAVTTDLIALDLGSQISGQLLPMSQRFFANLPEILKRTLTVMLLGPFLAFFLLKDGRQFSRGLLTLVPNSIFEVTYSIYHQINEQLGQFIRARLMESAIVALITWVGLLIINFPYAALLALFAGLVNLIPYIGPIIGVVPALAIALVQGMTGFDIGMLLLVYFIAQAIDAAFIIPVVVAKIVDLHPVLVILVIIVGAQLMGVLGMIISIPVASALKVTFGTIFRHLTDQRR